MRIIWNIVVISIVLILGGIAGWAVCNTSDSGSAIASAPADWETHQSKEFAIQFRYPPEWEVATERVNEGPAQARILVTRGDYTLHISLSRPERRFGGGLIRNEKPKDLVAIRDIAGYTLKREPKPLAPAGPGEHLVVNSRFYYPYGKQGYPYAYKNAVHYGGTAARFRYLVDRAVHDEGGFDEERFKTMDRIIQTFRFPQQT